MFLHSYNHFLLRISIKKINRLFTGFVYILSLSSSKGGRDVFGKAVLIRFAVIVPISFSIYLIESV